MPRQRLGDDLSKDLGRQVDGLHCTDAQERLLLGRQRQAQVVAVFTPGVPRVRLESETARTARVCAWRGTAWSRLMRSIGPPCPLGRDIARIRSARLESGLRTGAVLRSPTGRLRGSASCGAPFQVDPSPAGITSS
jgi:hypothetical protein